MRRTAPRMECLIHSHLLSLAAIAFLLAPVVAPAEDAQQRGLALVTRAVLLQDLRSSDSPPFRLHAHVKLFGLVVGTREGDYTFTFGGPGQWSEQLSFPGYLESRGVWEGKHWQKSSSFERPYRFYEVLRLFDPGRHLRIAPESSVLKLSQRQDEGKPSLCIEVSATDDVWDREIEGRSAVGTVGARKDTKYTLCFEGDSGALREAQYALPLPRYAYDGGLPLGNKTFPAHLRCFEGKDLVVDATVDILATIEAFNPVSVAPPAGATTWPVCEKPEIPRLLAKHEAESSHAKANRVYGTAVLFAEVGTDGLLHAVTPVQSQGAALAGAVQETVKNWRYQPAACAGTPVPLEIYLAYTFMP